MPKPERPIADAVRRLIRLAGLAIALFPAVARSQVVPDGTTSTRIDGCGSVCRIEGGATRGGTLFHSFEEFNVNAGQHVRFANPADISAIFTRVTGDSLSRIDGVLGVDGAADLFLLNPNGIIFGPNARLDVRGSFLATTADRFTFPDGSTFSATDAAVPNLLTVNVPIGLQYGASPGAIATQADLSVGEDLTLAAQNVTVGGNLQAGGNLSLQALDTLTVQNDRRPLLLSSGGNMLLEGDRALVIAAANATDDSAQMPRAGSEFLAGGNLILRSANPIEASGIFQASNTIEVEQLDGRAHDLTSADGVLFSTSGSFELGSYRGRSLSITSGDRVRITGDVSITGARTFAPSTETVPLSDGGQMVLHPTETPVLDIRAGLGSGENLNDIHSDITLSGTIRNSGGDVLLTNQYQPSGSSSPGLIITGTINTGTNGANTQGGRITLDAQGGIRTENLTSAAVVEFTPESIQVGNGGDIRLLSGTGGIRTGNLDTSVAIRQNENSSLSQPPIRSLSEVTLRTGDGGDVFIRAGSGLIETGDIDASTQIIPSSVARSLVFSDTSLISGQGGTIQIQTGNGSISVGELNTVSAIPPYMSDISVINSDFEAGRGGDIDVQTTQGNIETDFISTSSGIFLGLNSVLQGSSLTASDAGDLRLSTGNGNVSVEDGFINTDSSVNALYATSAVNSRAIAGNSGDVQITASNGRFDIESAFGFTGSINSLSYVAFPEATTDSVLESGNAGNVNILADRGNIYLSEINAVSYASTIIIPIAEGLVPNQGTSFLSNSSRIRAQNGGTISLQATRGSIYTGNLFSAARADFGDSGNAGSVELRAGNNVNTGSISTTSQAESGAITIQAQNDVLFGGMYSAPNGTAIRPEANALISSDAFGGQGGDIRITARSISLTDGSQISASTYGRGRGGDITLNADRITLRGTGESEPGRDASVYLFSTDSLRGGATGIPSNYQGSFIPTEDTRVNIATRSRNTTNSSGFTEVGLLRRPDFAEYPSGIFTQSSQGASGNAGNIRINTRELLIQDGAAIGATSFGRGNAGDITIRGDRIFVTNGSERGSIVSGAEGRLGRSGNIDISGNYLLLEGAGILTETAGGQGGDINISLTGGLILREGSRISTTAGTAQAGGDGGDITINTGFLFATPFGDNDITANAFAGRGGNITITSEIISGISERPATPGNGTSDIDASSQFSESGEIVITRPIVENLTGEAIELPEEIADVSQQIAAVCPTRAVAAEIGEFVITGRGGIPSNPTDILGGQVLMPQLATLDDDDEIESLISPPSQQEPAIAPKDAVRHPETMLSEETAARPGSTPGSTPIVEAQGWIETQDGQVVLTVEAPAGASHDAGLVSAQCATVSEVGS